MYYLNTFYFYSIIGFFIETIFLRLINSDGTSGIMYGPFTPIYGIGAIIILLISKFILKTFKTNKLTNSVLIFLSTTIILSLIEFIGGILIENIFGIVFWDYSDQKLSLGKYVSIPMSLLWGFMSIIFIYIIKPLFDKLILKIPKLVTIIVTIIFLTDLFITIITI